MTALTEAEENLVNIANAVRRNEIAVDAAQMDFDGAEAKLRGAQAYYANSVVALIEARKALR